MVQFNTILNQSRSQPKTARYERYTAQYACRRSVSFSNGDISKNVTKRTSLFLKFCRGYSDSRKISNVGEFP